MKFSALAVIGSLLGWFVIKPVFFNPTIYVIGDSCLGLLFAISLGIVFAGIENEKN